MANRKRKQLHQFSCRECKRRRNPNVVEYHRSINGVMQEMNEWSQRQPRDGPLDAAIIDYLQTHSKDGSTIGDLLQQFPTLSRDQLKAILKDLKTEGKVHSIGRTKGGRWNPGKATP